MTMNTPRYVSVIAESVTALLLFWSQLYNLNYHKFFVVSAHYLTVEIHNCSEKSNTGECQWLQKDWKMFNEITRIMKTNYWIIRSEDAYVSVKFK